MAAVLIPAPILKHKKPVGVGEIFSMTLYEAVAQLEKNNPIVESINFFVFRQISNDIINAT